MRVAITEAKKSLKEGNHGFGAVIVKENKIIAKAHDTEETDNDPTSHAEINVIKIASKKYDKNLSDCTIISTHEPCPMCSSAILWSKIRKVGYGFSIAESLKQDRKRIDISCKEIFERSGIVLDLKTDMLKDECQILYNKNVRDEIKRLRRVNKQKLYEYNEDSIKRRLLWFKENKDNFDFINENTLESAYKLLLCRFGINENDAPVILKENNKILFHSMNFCPTLEACKILDLDTRYICRRYNEKSTDILIKQIDQKLRFDRNYQKLRPYYEYCEEMIIKE